MNKKTTIEEIKKIAKREGKSDIREEMKKDILSVFLNSETRCKWDRLFGAGRLPSLEEFIKVLSLEVVKDKIRNYGIVVQKAVLLFSVVKLFYFMSIFCLKDSFSITSIVSVFWDVMVILGSSNKVCKFIYFKNWRIIWLYIDDFWYDVCYN